MPKLKREGILFCLVGPSAGGKTSMGAHLLATFPETLGRSVSATTRPPRDTEIEGTDYYFMDKDSFQQNIDDDQFFEWASVHGNMYGTLKKTVDSAITNGKDLLLDIDLQGIRSFKAAYPQNTVVSFIVPPSTDALVARMRSRSTISDAELKLRLETAEKEYEELRMLADSGWIEYFIVNDDKERSRRLVTAVYEAERLKMQRIDDSEVQRICKID